MKILFITLLCFMFSVFAFAQKTNPETTISGIIADSATGNALRTASVSLLTERDSAYINATISDGDGKFRIKNVATGNYRILATFLGYRNSSFVIRVTSQADNDIGSVLMSPVSNILNEVVVRQEHAPIIIKQDTLEFNAGSFKTQPNAQVEELLRKLPGVEVTRDGNIKANGQAVNRVLVDGKPFFGNDPKMATRNLPADIVDKVQVYDQSSDQSRFSGIDDGNQERTINITIKKDKGKGYFGQNAAGDGPSLDGATTRYQGKLSINRFNNRNGGPVRQFSVIGQANNLNQQNFTMGNGMGEPVIVGQPGSGGQDNNQPPTNIVEVKATGVNFRREGSKLGWGKRTEMSASYFANQAITTTDQKSRRGNILPEKSFTTEQDSYSKNRQTTQRINGRLDFQVNPLISMRISQNVSWQNVGFNSKNTSRSFLNSGNSLNSGNTRYGSWGNSFNVNNNLLLMKKFRREGRSFSANLNSILSNGKTNALNQSSNSFYDTTSANPVAENSLKQRILINNNSLQNTLTLSFTESLSLSKKLEFRYAFGNIQNTANRDVADLSETDTSEEKPNPGLSNDFMRFFNTHRTGASLQNRRLRYSYTLGVDLQHSNLKTNNKSSDQRINTPYFNILPNALFTYTFSGNRSLRFQYRTRINPPTVSQLQPVIDNSNPLSIRIGNPALRPEFYNNLTLTFNSSSEAGTKNLFAFASLNQSNNRINNSTTTKSNGLQTIQPINTNGYLSANGFVAIGRVIQQLNVLVSLNSNASLTKSNSLVNGENNESKNLVAGEGFRVQSRYNGKSDYGLNGMISYQTISYSLLSRQNTAFWSRYATADFHWQLPFHFAITSDLTYTATTGRATGYNQQFTLWNVALAKQFLKGNQGEIRVQVFDILNQNRSVVRNTSDAYVEDVQSTVLKRYFTISFVYNLRKFGV